MKTIKTLLLLAALCLPLAACNTQPTAQQLAGITALSYTGTSIALFERPLWYSGFQKAEAELRALSAGTNDVTVKDVAAIIQRLPYAQLKSPEARLYIGNGILLIETFGPGLSVPAEQVAAPRLLATAVADGVKRRLDEGPGL